MSDNRQPTMWLNYRGDQRQILSEGPKGPNLLGELLHPLVADYDAAADRTRVGFSLIAPAAVSA